MKLPHRDSVVSQLPLLVFLAAYLLTTVLANILYFTEIGRDLPALSIKGFSWASFTQDFGVPYWILLLLPFVVAPPVAWVTAILIRPRQLCLDVTLLEIPRAWYATAVVALYSFVLVNLAGADPLSHLLAPTDAIEAVEERFSIIESVGFWPLAAMKSLLVFAAVYAVVKAARHGGKFWWGVTALHILILSPSLALLNMKWPLVLFIFVLALGALVAARRHAFIKAGVIAGAGGVAYLIVSVVLLRLAVPVPGEQPWKTERGPGILAAAVKEAPKLGIVAINRMAMAIPYYYDVFTTEGHICGTIIDRVLRRTNPCQPSTEIYTRMFGDDGFAGRGTAPAAMQITGYALDGWLGALIELTLGSIILGGVLAFWPLAKISDAAATIYIMGCYAAYFMSQLPVEASIIYDHGAIWWGGALSVVAVANGLLRRRRMRMAESAKVHLPARHSVIRTGTDASRSSPADDRVAPLE